MGSYNPDLTVNRILAQKPGNNQFAGISVDPKTGTFFVSDVNQGGSGMVIQEYDPNGNPLGTPFNNGTMAWFTAVGPDGNPYATFIDSTRVATIERDHGTLDGTSQGHTFIGSAGT